MLLERLQRWIAARVPDRFYCRRANRIADRCAAEEEGIVCPCAAECPMSPVRLAFAVASVRRAVPRERDSRLEIDRI